MYNELLYIAIRASFIAGEEILNIYNQPFSVGYKEDKSPITEADKRASVVIEDMLNITEIPVLSEEGEHALFSIRKDWKQVWIIDPLDGTKEFVKRNGEFTVNIALVENQKPVIGVIYSPVYKDLYFSAEGLGAFKLGRHDVISIQESADKMSFDSILMYSKKLPLFTAKDAYVVVASRSHLSSEVYQYIENLKKTHTKVECINTGSSIKMCIVAEGTADEYPRFGDTMEWDTCAGQCIIEQAGGSVIDFITKKPLQYNREKLKNNWFIAKLPK